MRSFNNSLLISIEDHIPRIRIPNSCKGVDIIVGIDEAGRGPVLGDMIFLISVVIMGIGSLIYCAAFWPLLENEEISKLGFDDSKVLKEGERERLCPFTSTTS